MSSLITNLYIKEKKVQNGTDDKTESLKDMLMQLPAAIALMRGSDHVFEMANDLYYDIVGKTDLVGLPGRKAIGETVSQGLWDIIDNVYQTGEPFVASEFPVFNNEHKNGSEGLRYFKFAINPLYNHNHSVDGILIHAVDVTELVNTRNIIQESGEQFRFLANNIPQIVWKANPDGNIVLFNRCWYDFTGLTHQQSLDWHWTAALHPDDLENTLTQWRNSIKTGEPFEIEYRIRNDKGDYLWHLARATAMMDSSRKIIMWIGASSDINDRKESADQLEKAVEERTRELSAAIQDLSRSNSDLEQFAYVASHDLKEPIRMVSSFAMLLDRKYKDKLDAEGDEIIGYITEGANRMQELVDDLLAYSRIGRTDPKKDSLVDCNQIIEIVKANLLETIENSGAVITADHLPSIHGKEPELVRLFQNLIGNALKFKSPKLVPKISISVQKQKNQYLFSVKDNGIGIDPMFSEKIFVIFQRLHTREKYSGTGIGLAVCKKIVELHGGKIWVESTPGKGATFFFTMNE